MRGSPDDRGRPPWWFDPNDRRLAGGRQARARYFRRWAFAAMFMPAMFVAVMAFVRISQQASPTGGRIAVPLLVLATGFIFTLTLLRFGGIVRSLREVMDAADRVADGDYGVRVNESARPPIRALAQSFNTMTARLANADRLRRDLMADVAHELRTPLSVLQGRLEGLIDGVYPIDQAQLAQLLEETHVLSRLVEDLRTLALSEAGALPVQKESTDLVSLTRDVLRSLDGAGPVLDLSAPTAIVIDLDPVRIREVLTNLLSNAVRHTPSSGRIDVAIAAEKDRIVVTVKDTGQGIPPADLSRLFDRFYKGAESRGSGLGLAIAKGIVTAHGGEISAASTVGEGTTIQFSLPR